VSVELEVLAEWVALEEWAVLVASVDPVESGASAEWAVLVGLADSVVLAGSETAAATGATTRNIAAAHRIVIVRPRTDLAEMPVAIRSPGANPLRVNR